MQKVTKLVLRFWASVLKMKMIAISFLGGFAKYCTEKLYDLIYWTCQAVSETQRRLAVNIFIKDKKDKVLCVTLPWCLLLNTEERLYLKATSTQKIRRHFLFPVRGTNVERRVKIHAWKWKNYDMNSLKRPFLLIWEIFHFSHLINSTKMLDIMFHRIMNNLAFIQIQNTWDYQKFFHWACQVIPAPICQ